MLFSVDVCTLIDNDIRHHSGQNAPHESTRNFDHCDDEYKSADNAKQHSICFFTTINV